MGYDGTTIVAANGNATIAQSDVYTCQGIVQVIDAVMLPQSAIDALSGGGRRSLLQDMPVTMPSDPAGDSSVAMPSDPADEAPVTMPSDPAGDSPVAMPSDPADEAPVTMPSDPEKDMMDDTTDNNVVVVVPSADGGDDVGAGDGAGASNFNQGSPDCIKPDNTTGLVDAANNSPDHTTLAAAIKAAGLENAFDDTSAKVTAFAPTDDAFNAALSALGLTAEELLASPLLGDILKYHIVGEPYTADMLVDGISLPTLEGSSLMGYDGTTIVAANGNATIVQSDLYTCQGIVQVIDAVMLPQSAIDALSGGRRRSLLQFDAAPNATAEEMPTLSMPAANASAEEMPAGDEVAVAPASAETAAETSAGEYNQGVDACIYASSPATLVETASAVPDFSTLVAALQAADLASAFDDMSQKVTVFAPTNAAFEKLFAAENVTAEEVLANKDFLTKVLKYHVAGIVLPFESLVDGESISTLEGEDLGVSTAQVQYTNYAFGFPIGVASTDAKTVLGSASNATIVQGNVWSCNGVIQVIDEVLLPESALSSSQ